ncbi:MAG: hypothetical protein ACC662_09510 [Planctomycetota bacterium]
MRSRPILLVAFLAALLALSACGKEAKQGTPTSTTTEAAPGALAAAATPAPDDLAGLVPADTQALLYAPSLDALQTKARRIVASIDEDTAAQVDLGEMLKQLPIGDLVDRSKPFAVAVTFPPGENPEPVPTMIVSVTDVDAALAVMKKQGMPEPPATAGSYVAIRKGPPAEGAMGSPLMKDLPAGDVILRMDLATLVERFRPEITKGLDAMEKGMPSASAPGMPGMPDMSGFMKGMREAVQVFLDSAEQLDLVLTADGTKIRYEGRFTAKEGSALAKAPAGQGELADLAGILPADYPIVMMFSLDADQIYGRLDKLMNWATSMYPEPFRVKFQAFWGEMKGIYKYVGDRQVGAMRMAEDGVLFVAVMEVKDAQAYLTEWEALIQGDAVKGLEDFGFQYLVEAPKTVAGHEVHTVRMVFDWKKMMEAMGQEKEMPAEALDMMDGMMKKLFGPDGVTIHMADVDGNLVTVMGPDALLQSTLEAAASKRRPSGAIAAAIAEAGGHPTFLVRIEARSLVKQVLGLVRQIAPEKTRDDIPAAPEGGAVPFLFYGTASGRHYAGGFTVDVKAVADMVKQFIDMAKGK